MSNDINQISDADKTEVMLIVDKKFFAEIEENGIVEINNTLTKSYFDFVNINSFKKEAIEYTGERVHGLIGGVVYPVDMVGFYEKNRAELISWFEKYIDSVGHPSVLDYMVDLMEDEDDGEGLALDEIGRMMYGKETTHKHYRDFAIRLARFVAENLADLYNRFYHECLENWIKEKSEQEAILTDFHAYIVRGEQNEVGLDLAKKFIECVGSEKFVKKGLNFGRLRVNGVIEGVAYLQNPIAFFYENHDMIIKWLDGLASIEGYSSTLNFANRSLLSMEDRGVKVWSIVNSVDTLADIFYGKNSNNPHYELVVSRILMLLAEHLAGELAHLNHSEEVG
ncbi:MAG: hypothetical protein VYA60_11060 [Pseudomonadota bacterium]|nr:hypothetical protein [Pseudomonadota bacterium]